MPRLLVSLSALGILLTGILTIYGAEETDPFDGKKAGDEWSENDLKLNFRWCPAGKFKMGSPPKERSRDDSFSLVQETQVDVTLTHGFWLAQYELTQGAWESVMHTTVAEQTLKALSADRVVTGPDYPIFCINHDEAVEFCAKLTKQEQDAGRIPKNWEYRLPSEAQWEYACRAGTKTATHYGDSLSSKDANFNGKKPLNKGKPGPFLYEPAKVGQYKPNAWGLYDMHANVSEWCLDYSSKLLPGGIDPVVLKEDTSCIDRGGSCYSRGNDCRSADRGYAKKDHRDSSRGFRPALVFVPAK